MSAIQTSKARDPEVKFSPYDLSGAVVQVIGLPDVRAEMGDINATAIVGGSNLSHPGTEPPMVVTVEATACATSAQVDGHADKGQTEVATSQRGAFEPMTRVVQADLGDNIAAKAYEPATARPVSHIPGFPELFRVSRISEDVRTPLLEVEQGHESSVAEMADRSASVHAPTFGIYGIPLPTGSESFGTTRELFERVRTTIAELASLSTRDSALTTYWVFSTWCVESLPLAPCLVICGLAHEGDTLLRTLKNLCYNPRLTASLSTSLLKKINWLLTPTLLIDDTNMTRKIASLIGSSTRPGYLVGSGTCLQDFFCPKAVFVGEGVPVNRALRYSVEVDATAKPGIGPGFVRPLPQATVQSLLNQLVRYRHTNLVRIHGSNFDAFKLSGETRAVANALGACIVDAPELQAELVSLLAPCAEQHLADRSSSLEAVTAEATLALFHKGKSQLLVREIAAEVNRILAARGETIKYGAEKIGHKLKKIGLFTRRLGKAGNGLVRDLATLALVHEIRVAYGGASCGGSDKDAKPIHCALCIETKDVMQVM